jgi:ribosome maturation factor RimP
LVNGRFFLFGNKKFEIDKKEKEISVRENKKLEEIITPSLESMGYDLVRLLFLESDGDNRTLQIMVERKDRAPMSVDHCAEISSVLSALLDVEDPIEGRYCLEVSSAGIDRPLIKFEDYNRFKGFSAKVETKTLMDGRKRFKGKILQTDEKDKTISLEEETGVVNISFDDIAKAKLILTDELIDSYFKKSV